MLIGILLPFAGTVLGSACVFFLKSLKKKIDKLLTGFAAGVMVAASVWSLLIPAMEQSENMGRLAFVPASVGFLLGIGFLLCIDEVVPHLHMYSDKPEGIKSGLSKHAMMLLAVTIHNIPEGMAVGVVLAAMQAEQSGITIGAAPIPRASHPPAALCADPVDRYWFSSLLIPVWFSAVTGYKPHYREGERVCQDILS